MTNDDSSDTGRRGVLLGGALGAMGLAATATAQVPLHPRSAGPIVPGRDS